MATQRGLAKARSLCNKNLCGAFNCDHKWDVKDWISCIFNYFFSCDRPHTHKCIERFGCFCGSTSLFFCLSWFFFTTLFPSTSMIVLLVVRTAMVASSPTMQMDWVATTTAAQSQIIFTPSLIQIPMIAITTPAVVLVLTLLKITILFFQILEIADRDNQLFWQQNECSRFHEIILQVKPSFRERLLPLRCDQESKHELSIAARITTLQKSQQSTFVLWSTNNVRKWRDAAVFYTRLALPDTPSRLGALSRSIKFVPLLF